MIIEAARLTDGTEPVQEYLGRLRRSRGHGGRNPRRLGDIVIVLEDFARSGGLEVPRELNYLRGDIWEIKAGDTRLPFFYVNDVRHGTAARITSGFNKQQGPTPTKEINKALWVQGEDLAWDKEMGEPQ
jgi:hypothetical protein